MELWRDPNPSNKAGTCLWCGRKLLYGTSLVNQRADAPVETKRNTKAGGYEDDTFCGLRCGYQFGLAFARLGKRLQNQP